MFTSADDGNMSRGFASMRDPSPLRAFDLEGGAPRARIPLFGRISRRGRVVLAGLVCVGVMLYLAAPARDSLKPYYSGSPQSPYSPTPEADSEATGPGEYIVDEHGDHFYPHYPLHIAPMHPAPKDLVDPATLFPEVDESFLADPVWKKFPAEKLRDIVSEAPEEVPDTNAKAMPDDAYFSTWVGPEDWEDAGPGVGKLQWDGFAGSYETAGEKELRLKRKEAVKRGFIYAWQKYKDLAWGHDEVKPVSKAVNNPFNNWGASIVDTLDTLLLLGLEDEYNLCRPHVNQLNFHWVGGRDWSQGYIARDDEIGDDGKPWEIKRDRTATVPVFETGIRYLGGLLGAYDLSGDKLMLDRAVDVAEVLKRAFNTRSGLPNGQRFDPGYAGDLLTVYTVSLAEVGSMSLELIRLSRAIGDRKWFDLAQRVTDFLETKLAPNSEFPPLLPMNFSPDAGSKKISGSFSFGALADSYYEYLIKAYKLLGGGPLAEPYKRLYTGSIDAARKLFFVDIDAVPGRDLFTIGKWEYKSLSKQAEHLTCFAGGMLGMGAILLSRRDDMRDAKRFTETCYWISAATRTGVQPENVWFFNKDSPKRVVNYTLDGRIAHPPAELFSENLIDYDMTYKDKHGVLRFNDDRTPVEEDSGRNGKPLEYYSELTGNPPGTSHTSKYYINRPETIESVFYMYRLTGDKKWQEKGWRMFTSWMKHSKVAGGISSIADVTEDPSKLRLSDNMESFIFAETFKYHYLLHAGPEEMSLDDYVLNTEAHPFIANGKQPGWQHLWTDPKQELGARGQGTDAQKWLRHMHIGLERQRQLAPKTPPKPPGGGSGPPRWGNGKPPVGGKPGGGRGGGGGMGGGGGNPNWRPQPGD